MRKRLFQSSLTEKYISQKRRKHEHNIESSRQGGNSTYDLNNEQPKIIQSEKKVKNTIRLILNNEECI